MKLKAIQKVRDVIPFKPFNLHLTSGRAIKISTPDHLLFSPRGDLLLVFPSAGGICVVEPGPRREPGLGPGGLVRKRRLSRAAKAGTTGGHE